jgi:dynactin complex subunit
MCNANINSLKKHKKLEQKYENSLRQSSMIASNSTRVLAIKPTTYGLSEKLEILIEFVKNFDVKEISVFIDQISNSFQFSFLVKEISSLKHRFYCLMKYCLNYA